MYINHFTDKLLEENKQMKRQIELYESTDSIKRIKELTEKQIRTSHEHEKQYRDGWHNCLTANKELQQANAQLKKERDTYKTRLRTAEVKQIQLQQQAEYAEHQRSKAEARAEKAEKDCKEKDAQIAALKEEICRLKSIMNHDGTTNGIPTSKTPENKKKVIPNTREKTGKAKGGQPGHAKHSMKEYENVEPSELIDYFIDNCPKCGGPLERTDEYIDKDEMDYIVKVIKRRHRFHNSVC